jgi:L-ascorbate metabolism protein UlaG (beta-lactamase superfamily)
VEGTALWWTGHNGWLIKSNDVLIGTDLVLEYSGRLAPSPVSSLDLADELDVLFITHGHGDHFGRATVRALVEHSQCIFVIPESTISIAAELGIPDDRVRVARPREPFDVGNVHVEPIRAIHGNARFAVYYEANLQDVGYAITVNGVTFLQPGDSVLLEDHLFLEDVDVLFFSPTEHNTYIEPSVILVNTLSPDYIFPQHHSTMKYDERDRFWAKGYPDEVKLRLSKPLQERYHIVEPGVRFDIENSK